MVFDVIMSANDSDKVCCAEVMDVLFYGGPCITTHVFKTSVHAFFMALDFTQSCVTRDLCSNSNSLKVFHKLMISSVL